MKSCLTLAILFGLHDQDREIGWKFPVKKTRALVVRMQDIRHVQGWRENISISSFNLCFWVGSLLTALPLDHHLPFYTALTAPASTLISKPVSILYYQLKSYAVLVYRTYYAIDSFIFIMTLWAPLTFDIIVHDESLNRNIWYIVISHS